MDFNQFDSRAAADKGAWMHVRSPINGKPMFDDGKPCRVKVLGVEGEIGQKLMSDARKQMKGDFDEIDAQDRMVSEALPLIVDFENIHRGKKLATAPDDSEWFLRMQKVVGGNEKSFVEQVRDFALIRANFLGNGLPD